METWINEEIPIETVYKHVLRENEKLKIEIDKLKAELEKKNKAIEDFKIWQSKVAKFRYEYWLNEGLKLMDEQPKELIYKKIRRLLVREERFKQYFDRFENVYLKMIDARDSLAQEIKQCYEDTSDDEL